MRDEDLCGASDASPGRDHDVERHVGDDGPVGVQEQTWVENIIISKMLSELYEVSSPAKNVRP